MALVYLESTALVACLRPDPAGDRVTEIWAAADGAVTNDGAEIEVPALAGREIDRIAWVWTVNSLMVTTLSPRARDEAIDLAWLGAPASAAVHVAAALDAGAEPFVTADPAIADWAELKGLPTVLV